MTSAQTRISRTDVAIALVVSALGVFLMVDERPGPHGRDTGP